MHSDLATAPSRGDLANRLDGKQRRSTQEAGLLRWLQAKAPATAPAEPVAARPILLDAPSLPSSGRRKATTLRQALLAEGLDIVPDPLERYPCPKVERAKDLRG